jgi:hypothetical protein
MATQRVLSDHALMVALPDLVLSVADVEIMVTLALAGTLDGAA